MKKFICKDEKCSEKVLCNPCKNRLRSKKYKERKMQQFLCGDSQILNDGYDIVEVIFEPDKENGWFQGAMFTARDIVDNLLDGNFTPNSVIEIHRRLRSLKLGPGIYRVLGDGEKLEIVEIPPKVAEVLMRVWQ